uniref:IQ and AAA domain-containing protein 1 n=1 Tax=Lygus hesperus TaxID=30085 RepID=A0A0A9X5L9_LYGHE
MRELGFYEDDATGIIMTEMKALRLIQTHERARQGRLRAQFMKEIRSLKDKIKAEPKEEELEEGARKAALKIQKIWRGYITRRKIRKRVVEEMLLIGMLPGAYTSVAERTRAEEVKEDRRRLQEVRQEEYESALVTIRDDIKKHRGPAMMEEMGDEVRAWFMGYKDQTGKFPDMPTEEAGGSALIFSRQGQAESERSKSTAPSSKESKKGGKGKKGVKEKEEVKKRPEDEEDLGFKMSGSSFLADLMVAGADYEEKWKNLDETKNPAQNYYDDMIRKDKTAEVEAELRKVILEYCIMPLGSPQVHKNSPIVRSVLIAGPQGSGKRLLINAICTETGATLFDLSPANIVGKYPGKSGLVMLLHLVSKVSRLLQPSVIYIDTAEKTFMKKVPKTDKTDPKRLKKDLAKLIKGIGPEDQVIVIGTTRLPWECDQKLLQQAYHKMILIPRPDYASLSLLWTEQLFQYAGLSRQFNTSSLARLSDGYTVGSILSAIKDVLTCKRVLQLRMHQLTHAEIINVLCKKEPVYKEEEEEFLTWFSKTPIGRRKQKALEMEAEKIKELESVQT